MKENYEENVNDTGGYYVNLIVLLTLESYSQQEIFSINRDKAFFIDNGTSVFIDS